MTRIEVADAMGTIDMCRIGECGTVSFEETKDQGEIRDAEKVVNQPDVIIPRHDGQQ